jgi:hypothetical protein
VTDSIPTQVNQLSAASREKQPEEQVGYSNGDIRPVDDPTERQVCSGNESSGQEKSKDER